MVSPGSEAEADDGGAAGEEKCADRRQRKRESRALVALGMQPVSSCQKQKRQ